jgi:hypothetical protein
LRLREILVRQKIKPKRIAILIGLLAAVGGGGLAGFTYWDQKQQIAERDRSEQEARAAMERKRADEMSKIIGTVRLAADHSVPRQEINQRSAQLMQLLMRTKAQYVVFPPSAPMSRPSLDLTARIAIARQLARMIEAETRTPVPDPALVFEAYGAPRRMMPEIVAGYLMESDIQWLVTGIATHDANGAMTIQLVKLPIKAAPPPTIPAFERNGIAISEEQLPEMAFRPLAAQALQALGFQGVPVALVKEEAPVRLSLAASPIEAEKQQQTALEGLWLQQMIGVLHHSLDYMDTRPRERIFERVLSGIADVSPESGDYPVLMARALLYLGRPTAARKALEGAPATPEGKALLAYLKSDLPALKSAVPAIERQIPRLIAECELIRLRADFRDLSQTALRVETERLVQSVPEGWQHLIGLFVAHQSEWTMPPPSRLKPILDRDFPVQGYRIDDIVRGKEALGESPADEKTAAELTLSALVHATKWRRQRWRAVLRAGQQRMASLRPCAVSRPDGSARGRRGRRPSSVSD